MGPEFVRIERARPIPLAEGLVVVEVAVRPRAGLQASTLPREVTVAIARTSTRHAPFDEEGPRHQLDRREDPLSLLRLLVLPKPGEQKREPSRARGTGSAIIKRRADCSRRPR